MLILANIFGEAQTVNFTQAIHFYIMTFSISGDLEYQEDGSPLTGVNKDEGVDCGKVGRCGTVVAISEECAHHGSVEVLI